MSPNDIRRRLASVVIALERVDAGECLQLSGIDLDSGDRLTISIAPGSRSPSPAPNAAGLILSLSLSESPLSH